MERGFKNAVYCDFDNKRIIYIIEKVFNSKIKEIRVNLKDYIYFFLLKNNTLVSVSGTMITNIHNEQTDYFNFKEWLKINKKQKTFKKINQTDDEKLPFE